MIEYVRGQLASSSPASAIVDCSGVGYEVLITLPDFTAIQSKGEVLLYTHEILREDSRQLYGFTTREARETFRLLIGVNGVGPGTARLIMSAMSVADLENVIASGQENMLRAVKGVGTRTAQRIIVDLKDKIKGGASALITQVPDASGAWEESLQALLMLGFAKPQSEKALKNIFAASPSLKVEEAVRQALKML